MKGPRVRKYDILPCSASLDNAPTADLRVCDSPGPRRPMIWGVASLINFRNLGSSRIVIRNVQVEQLYILPGSESLFNAAAPKLLIFPRRVAICWMAAPFFARSDVQYLEPYEIRTLSSTLSEAAFNGDNIVTLGFEWRVEFKMAYLIGCSVGLVFGRLWYVHSSVSPRRVMIVGAHRFPGGTNASERVEADRR